MPDLPAVCKRLGVEDVFALKQVEGGQLGNLARHGRDAGNRPAEILRAGSGDVG
jgi:hypothetical protein